MIKSRGLIFLFSICFLIFSAVSCKRKETGGRVNANLEKVVTLNFSPSRTEERLKSFGGIHPLDLSVLSMNYFRRGEIGRGIKLLETLFSQYPIYHTGGGLVFGYSRKWKIGRGVHRKKRKFWWSCMAQSAVAMALYRAYLVSGEKKYINSIEEVLKPVVTLTDNGGGAVRVGNGRWYLEYVFRGASEKNVEFVLNGFLYSLLVIGYLSKELHWSWLKKAFEDGVTAYLNLREKFFYTTNGAEWTLYSLLPSIDPPHYHIFVIELLDSLWQISKIDIFKRDAVKWTKILFKNYPFLEKSNELYWSSVGPPYWWWVDIRYGILFKYSGKKIFVKGWKDGIRNLSSLIFAMGRKRSSLITLSILAEDNVPVITFTQDLKEFTEKEVQYKPLLIRFKRKYKDGVRVVFNHADSPVNILVIGRVTGLKENSQIRCSRLFLEFDNGIVVKKYNPPLPSRFILPVSFLSFYPEKKGPWKLKALRLFPCYRNGYSIDVEGVYLFNNVLALEEVARKFSPYRVVLVPHG